MPAVEERPDEVRPRRAVGEGAVAVDQHLLGQVGAGGDVHRDAEDVEPVELAVGLAQELVVADRVVAQLQQVRQAEHRAARLLQPDGSGHRHRRPPHRWNGETNLFQCITMTTAQREPASSAEALPLGPDSLTWRYFGDNRMALLGPRAAVLQNMLPGARPGRGGPLRLVRRDPRPAAAQHPADLQHGLRRRPRDQRPRGARLPPADQGPAARRVAVQRAEPGHLLLGARLLRRAPDHRDRHLHPPAQSRRRRSRSSRESITWFERYGVSSRGTPQTYAEFVDYFEHALEERLVAHRTASYGVGYATKGWPRPKRVPAPVWWLVRRPVNAVSSSITIGGMPPRGREILGLPWDATRERRYQRFAADQPRPERPLRPAARPLPDAPDPAARVQARGPAGLTARGSRPRPAPGRRRA